MIQYTVYSNRPGAGPTAAAMTDGTRLFTAGIDLSKISTYEAAHLREGLAQGRHDVILTTAGAGRPVHTPRQVEEDDDQWDDLTVMLGHLISDTL
jgi:hypothetical protein